MNIFQLDIQGIFLIQGILFIALPLTAWTILWRRHDPKSVALWCGGGLMWGIGLVFLGLRGHAHDWIGYQSAIVFIFGSFFVRGAALQIELQRKTPWSFFLFLCGLIVIAYMIADATGRDFRELYVVVVRLALTIWIASLAFQLHRREATRSAMMLCAVFLLAGATSLMRLFSLAEVWGTGHIPTAWDYMPNYFSALLVVLYGNLGYAGLILERLRTKEQQRTTELMREHQRRREAEQHASELDAMLLYRSEILNEATPAMLHSIDQNGRLLAVSDAWLFRMGYSRHEVIGRYSSEFLTAESQDYARQVVLPAFFHAGRCENVAYKMVRKDGCIIDVSLSAILQRDAQGKALRSLAVIEDVTEKLARAAELEHEQAQRLQIEHHAKELERLLAERDEMLDVLAHEVRQPLNNASAALQSAGAVLALSGEEEASARLQRAQNVLRDVTASLDNTLAASALLASARPISFADTDVDTLIAVVIADMAVTERSRVLVERLTSTRTAAMDMGLMRLALRNLLANALSYSLPGSSVTVRIADSDTPLALVIEVSDTGPGFEPELVPRLFERHVRGYQGHGKAGHGIGLHIVRRIMELHHGEVALVTNAQNLTSMRLVIPQASAALT